MTIISSEENEFKGSLYGNDNEVKKAILVYFADQNKTNYRDNTRQLGYILHHQWRSYPHFAPYTLTLKLLVQPS